MSEHPGDPPKVAGRRVLEVERVTDPNGPAGPRVMAHVEGMAADYGWTAELDRPPTGQGMEITLHVEVYPTVAPAREGAVVAAALGELARATGLLRRVRADGLRRPVVEGEGGSQQPAGGA